MHPLHPFFIQYHVRQLPQPTPTNCPREGMATIVVFADSREVACARASRMIAENKLEIIGLARIHLIGQQALDGLNSIVLSLYRRAELYGVSLHCDYWPIRSGCCTGDNPSQQP